MKKKNILLSILCSAFLVTSMVIPFTLGNNNEAYAKERTNSYWESVFEVESEGDVTFTSNQTVRDYMQGVTSYSMKKNGATQNYGKSAPVGLGVSFSKDTKLTYKTPVFLDYLDINTKLIEFFVNPQTRSTTDSGASSSSDRDFNKISITLTDVSDPSVYVEIVVTSSDYDVNLGWLTAGTGETGRHGYHSADNKMNGNGRGSPVSATFAGVSRSSFSFSYDNEDNAAFFAPALYKSANLYSNPDLQLIRDLDNAAHMVGNDAMFNGFKSEYAKLSIEFSSINAGRGDANVILMNVLDQSLVGDTLIDKTAPSLIIPDTVDVNNLPKAQKGKFYPFWAFGGYDAIEYDVTDNIVFKILDPSGSEVEIDTKNYGFTPTVSGRYKAIVSVNDSANNKTTKEYEFEVVEVVEELEVEFYSDLASKVSIGETITLPKYSISGGSGYVHQEYKVLYDDRTKEATVVNNKVKIETPGYYFISLKIYDHYGEAKYYEKALLADYSIAPIMEDVYVQSSVVPGKKIYINKPIAYDYAALVGVPIEVNVETYISKSKDSGYTLVEGNYYQTKETDTGKYYIKFKATALNGTTSEYITETKNPYEVELYKPTTYGELFYDIGNKVDYEYKKITDKAPSETTFYVPTENGATIEYINAVYANAFQTSFVADEGCANFKKVTVRLIDSESISETVTVVLDGSEGNKTQLSTLFASAPIDNKLYGNEYIGTVGFKLKYGNTLCDILNNPLITIEKFDNGNTFSGFSSGKINVQIEFTELDLENGKQAKLYITDFVYQANFSSNDPSKERVKPVILLQGYINTCVPRMTNVTIPAIMAADMISPECSRTVSLKDPDGNLVRTVGGEIIKDLDASKTYNVTLSSYGVYTLEYVSKDDNNNKATTQITITVYDVVAPQIEIEGQIKSEYKVGDYLSVPNYRATDNHTEADELIVYVYVTTPTFALKLVSIDGNNLEYKFVNEGTYTLTFFVTDKEGNYVKQEYAFKVTK